MNPFHLAITVQSLEPCRTFYRDVLACEEGRSSDHWVDFNFFGHQFVLHQDTQFQKPEQSNNPVDGKAVPVPHFGVVLDWEVWEKLAERLKQHKIEFVIEPYIRFKGEIGEQATLFFLDPEGNALEFKAFKDRSQIFSK
ncbi:MAG: VOC family protein [Flavobacteriales bacterium]|nr:VOC family protein [Flavobacteriales bacterium]